MPVQAPRDGAVLCQGAFIAEEDSCNFLRRNSIENLTASFGSDHALYGCMGFPFAKVEEILSSEQRINFLYILINSPLDPNFRVYDEYIFKNFPCTTSLLKQMREGGDLYVYKKKNRDVLFVKFHNIYEAEPLLRLTLQ